MVQFLVLSYRFYWVNSSRHITNHHSRSFSIWPLLIFQMYLDLMDMSAYDAAKYSKVEDLGAAAGENLKPALEPRKDVSSRRKWSSLRQ